MLDLRNTLKITVLVMLFLSSTISVTIKINGSPSASATPDSAMVYVNPETNTWDVDDTFTIDVVVANVADLYGVDIRFSWDPTILQYLSYTMKIPVEDFPGGILHEQVLSVKDDVDATAGTYWLSQASLDPAPVFDGIGIAFNMTFKVKKLSACTLDITRADLSDHEGWPLEGTAVKDGYFLPEGAPQARFTWWPNVGVVGKPAIFNASESSDAEGTVEKYYWDFDDGQTTPTDDPIINHTFSHALDTKTYSVSLTVEDDTGINSTKAVEQVRIVKSRNIKIESVSPSTKKVLVESTLYVNVTFSNDGYTTENFTLTAYYNTSATVWTMINTTDIVNLSPGARAYSFGWNTTGVEAEKYYVIQVNATTVPYEDDTDNTKTSESVFITATEEHDLTVRTLSFQASHGGRQFAPPIILGESALFTITIENLGTVPEQTYNVTLHSNGTLIKEWNVTDALPSGQSRTLTWTWDNIPQRGQYNITIQVAIVNDIDTQNNHLQKNMQVIESLLLQIDYTLETPIVNQTTTLDASSSTHREPGGNIISCSWEIYTPRQTVDLDVPIYKTGITVNYNFTQEGNWTIVLKVEDNYGIKYDARRTLTSPYRLEEVKLVQSEGADGEDGEGIPVEYIAIIIVVIVAVIAALIVIYRRRSKPTP